MGYLSTISTHPCYVNGEHSPSSAIASASLRWFPPESVFARRSAYGASPVAASTRTTSGAWRGTPLSAAYSARCSRTFSCASIAVNCGHTPSASRAACVCATTEWPLIEIEPEEGVISPPVSVV